jgi:cytochrome c-type biogenesis protein CcmH/NrfF
MTRLALMVAVFLLAAPGTALAAAAGCPKTSTSDIADEVMCLQCGVPLNVAEEAPSAKRQRAFIQQQVDQCKSKEEIKTALVAQFGENVLADPKEKATWLVPAIGFGLAIVALAFAAIRWRGRRRLAGAAPASPAAAPTGDAARLQDDLDRYDL